MGRAEAAIFCGILLLAAVTRLVRPDLTEFKADEGRLLTAALEMSKGSFALRGISSSVGFPNAPMSVWIYSLPLLIWRHPYAAVLFTGLLSVAAVVGTYWLGRRTFGAPAAVLASLLLATSPWAIIFSRKIWAQNLLPLIGVGWAIAAILTFIEGRPKFIILHLLLLAVAVQIHPAAIGLVPATVLFLIVYRRRVNWRLLIVGGLLSFLTAAPFLWYLWGRIRSEGGLPFSSGQASAAVTLDSLRLSFEIAVGEGIQAIAYPIESGIPGIAAVRLVTLILLLAGIVWGGHKIVRRRNEPAAQVAFIYLMWFLGPVAMFLWHRTPVYVHYFIISLPALYLLTGAMIKELGADRIQLARALGAAVILIALLQLGSWVNLMRVVDGAPGTGGFGIPLGYKVAAADSARDLMTRENAAEILIVGDGFDPERDDFPAEFRALLHDVPVRFVDLNAEALFPAKAVVALLEQQTADRATSTRDLFEDAASITETVAVYDSLAYTIAGLPPAAASDANRLFPQPVLLANFVHLIGYDDLHLQTEGYLWDIYWQTADNPDAADYHIFNHLLDGTGTRIAQADGAAFNGSQWRQGDVVISRFLIPLPAESEPPLTMRVGMYRYPAMKSVPLLDEAANPVSDSLEILLDR